MFKVILAGVLLCTTSLVFAQGAQEQTPEQATELFMSYSDADKQSVLLDLISAKKAEQAGYLLEQWEKTAPEGKGPNEFLKSYISGLIKAQE